jgi:hypothetical protein
MAGISRNDICMDEPFSIWLSQYQPLEIFRICLSGNNMPVFEWMMFPYLKITGFSDPLLLRLPSVLFSAACITIWYFIFLNENKITSAIASVLVLLLSQPLQLLAHEFRCYSLFYLLCTLQIMFTIDLVRKKKSVKLFFGASFINCLLVFTHYLAFFSLAAQFIILLVFLKKKAIRQMLFLFLPTCILLCPVLFQILNRIAQSDHFTWVPALTWEVFYGSVISFMNGWITLLCFAVGLAFTFLKNKSIRLSDIHVVLLFFFLVPLWGMLLFSLKSPIITPRYLGFLMIPCLVFFVTLPSSGRGRQIPALVALLFMLSKFDHAPWSGRSPNEFVAYAKSQKRKNENIYLYPGFRNLEFAWYWNRDFFSTPDSINARLAKDGVYVINQFDDLKEHAWGETSFLLCEADVEGLMPAYSLHVMVRNERIKSSSAYFPYTYYVTRFISPHGGKSNP